MGRRGRARAGDISPCQWVHSAAERGPGGQSALSGNLFPPCRPQTFSPKVRQLLSGLRGENPRTPFNKHLLGVHCQLGPGGSRLRRGTPRGCWEAEGSPSPTPGSGNSSWRKQTSLRREALLLAPSAHFSSFRAASPFLPGVVGADDHQVAGLPARTLSPPRGRHRTLRLLARRRGAGRVRTAGEY